MRERGFDEIFKALRGQWQEFRPLSPHSRFFPQCAGIARTTDRSARRSCDLPSIPLILAVSRNAALLSLDITRNINGCAQRLRALRTAQRRQPRLELILRNSDRVGDRSGTATGLRRVPSRYRVYRVKMKLTVKTRSGRLLGEFDLPAESHVSDLRVAIHKQHKHLYPDRQRLYSNVGDAGARPQVLNENEPLVDGQEVLFKDLGPQISWKTVFIVEYLGPLLIYPIFYMQPAFIYGALAGQEPDPWRQEVQLSALIAWTVHYSKRELETLFVHRFSHATMPIANIFKNCAYYWGFAAFVAFFVNHPLYTPSTEENVYTGLCLFYFMEVGNFSTHWTLRNLRPPGTKVRRIPEGGLFDYVTCPNYTYEILAWLGFNLMTHTAAGVLFMLAGAGQMLIWARGKHRNYLKEFDGCDGRRLYPPERRILIPYIY